MCKPETKRSIGGFLQVCPTPTVQPASSRHPFNKLPSPGEFAFVFQ